MNAPTVTVLITAYNAERWLPETLASVRAQTGVEFEILVVDDGSTDGTLALLRRTAAEEPRLRIVPQANAGIARARNRGLAEARGRYTCLLDADDLFLPGKLARQVAALDAAPGPAFCLTRSRRFIDEATGRRLLAEISLPSAGGDYVRRLSLLDIYSMQLFNTALVPTAVLREIGGWDPAYSTAEDWSTWMTIARRIPPVHLDEVLYLYRKHETSASRLTAPGRALATHLQILADQHAAGALDGTAWRRAYAEKLLEHATIARIGGHRLDALRLLVRAAWLKLRPDSRLAREAWRLAKSLVRSGPAERPSG
jgi:glycosyltransferase involved in cell wall biosynthesis